MTENEHLHANCLELSDNFHGVYEDVLPREVPLLLDTVDQHLHLDSLVVVNDILVVDDLRSRDLRRRNLPMNLDQNLARVLLVPLSTVLLTIVMALVFFGLTRVDHGHARRQKLLIPLLRELPAFYLDGAVLFGSSSDILVFFFR